MGGARIFGMKIKMNDQLEFSLPNQTRCRSLSRVRPQRRRAAFWFETMRRVVDNAKDWPPSPISQHPNPEANVV